jgi:hypothetical protein
MMVGVSNAVLAAYFIERDQEINNIFEILLQITAVISAFVIPIEILYNSYRKRLYCFA